MVEKDTAEGIFRKNAMQATNDRQLGAFFGSRMVVCAGAIIIILEKIKLP